MGGGGGGGGVKWYCGDSYTFYICRGWPNEVQTFPAYFLRTTFPSTSSQFETQVRRTQAAQRLPPWQALQNLQQHPQLQKLPPQPFCGSLSQFSAKFSWSHPLDIVEQRCYLSKMDLWRTYIAINSLRITFVSGSTLHEEQPFHALYLSFLQFVHFWCFSCRVYFKKENMMIPCIYKCIPSFFLPLGKPEARSVPRSAIVSGLGKTEKEFLVSNVSPISSTFSSKPLPHMVWPPPWLRWRNGSRKSWMNGLDGRRCMDQPTSADQNDDTMIIITDQLRYW